MLLSGAMLSASALAADHARAHRTRHADRLIVPGVSEYGCPILPPEDPLNQEVADLPESPLSQQYVQSIGLTAHLHPDFGVNPAYGIPYEVVGPEQAKVAVKFNKYKRESDPGP
jgi:hypothetical protein